MTLDILLTAIREGTLIPEAMFVRDDLDEILDQRDEPNFEGPSLECSERIAAVWDSEARDEALNNAVNEVCKESFLVVSRATTQHEIASYVSYDFELIGKSIALGMNDSYADFLLESYSRGEIPR